MKNSKILYTVVIISLILSIVASGFTAQTYFNWHLFGKSVEITEFQEEAEVRTEDSDSIQRLAQEESEVINTVSKSQNAVVSVIVTKDLPILEKYYEKQSSPFDGFDLFFRNFGDDPFFSPFEFRIPKYREKGKE